MKRAVGLTNGRERDKGPIKKPFSQILSAEISQDEGKKGGKGKGKDFMSG